MLSNLLQELALARDYGRKRIVLDEARLTENPVDRLSRMIKNSFWNSLTRRIDGDGLEIICADPKNRSVPGGEARGIRVARGTSSELISFPFESQDEQRQAFDLRASRRARDGRVLPRSVSPLPLTPSSSARSLTLCPARPPRPPPARKPSPISASKSSSSLPTLPTRPSSSL